jgi:transcription initiation factor TFIIIB Brf1 subunit/transcription initiation factor TFIIB
VAKNPVLDKILRLLGVFHLDNEYIATRVFNRVFKVYFSRVQQKLLQPTLRRERIAMAFSIASVLNEEAVPRPLSFIANVCGLPPDERKCLLNVQRVLRLDFPASFTDARPEDFVSGLCLHFELPFSIGQQAERILSRSEIKYGLFGHKPHHLALAAIVKVIGMRNLKCSFNHLCTEIECHEATIKRIMKKIPDHMCFE